MKPQQFGQLLATMLMLSGCKSVIASQKNNDSPPISGAQSFDLTEKQVRALTANAKKGDSDAAYKLYQYYGMAKADDAAGFPWLKQAATAGHGGAQYALGIHLYNNDETKKQGVVWIEKAAAKGLPAAKDMVKWMAEKEKERGK